MLSPTGYSLCMRQLEKIIVDHGWGQITMKVTTKNNDETIIEISAGRSYIFKVKKDVKFNPQEII